MFIVQCTLFSLHCTVYSLHCTVFIVHCTVFIVHCTVYIVQCTLYIIQCTLFSLHCTVYSVQCSLYSVHCSVYIVHCTVYIVQCSLYIVQCSLYIVQCTLYIIQCTLYSLHCTVYILHCTVFIVHCRVFIILCTLYSLYCTVYSYILHTFYLTFITKSPPSLLSNKMKAHTHSPWCIAALPVKTSSNQIEAQYDEFSAHHAAHRPTFCRQKTVPSASALLHQQPHPPASAAPGLFEKHLQRRLHSGSGGAADDPAAGGATTINSMSLPSRRPRLDIDDLLLSPCRVVTDDSCAPAANAETIGTAGNLSSQMSSQMSSALVVGVDPPGGVSTSSRACVVNGDGGGGVALIGGVASGLDVEALLRTPLENLVCVYMLFIFPKSIFTIFPIVEIYVTAKSSNC